MQTSIFEGFDHILEIIQRVVKCPKSGSLLYTVCVSIYNFMECSYLVLVFKNISFYKK